MEAEDWRQEQERVERVRNKLQARIAKLEPEVAGPRDQATDIRKLRPKLADGTTNASFFVRSVRGPCTGFIFTRQAIGRRSCRHCLRICM